MIFFVVVGPQAPKLLGAASDGRIPATCRFTGAQVWLGSCVGNLCVASLTRNLRTCLCYFGTAGEGKACGDLGIG